MKIKILNLTFLICIIYVNAFTQITITVQKTLGGSGADYFTCLTPTRDGGLISGGTSFSDISFEKSENGRGNGDYWVVKTDKLGKIQWDKTIGGSDNDNLKSIIQTSDGGYALIGESSSNISFEKSENSRGSSDYWLVKLDSKGNIQWDKTIGGSGTEYIDNFVQTEDGGYILAGSSDSYISGEKSENSRGFFDYWVVKLNKYGKKIWDKTIGGNGYDWCSPISLTKDGGVIVGGFSNSNISGEKTEDSRGGSDYWLVKLDSRGNIQWDKTIGGSADEYCHGIDQTDDGGYIIAGSSLSGVSGEKTEYNRGGADYWAVKIDRNRKIQWDKTIGGSGDDWCNNMIQTKSGGYMLVGGSLSSPDSSGRGDKSEYSRGGADYWVVNLDNRGKLIWEKTIGGYYDDWGDAVAEPQKNLFWVGGLSYSPIGADKTDFARDNGDYWIVQLNYKKSCADADAIAADVYSQSIQENLVEKALTAYPNPFSTSTTISFTLLQSQKVSIQIFDIEGRLIKTLANEQMATGVHQITWNATNESGGVIANGMYYLKINSGRYAETKKISVVK